MGSCSKGCVVVEGYLQHQNLLRHATLHRDHTDYVVCVGQVVVYFPTEVALSRVAEEKRGVMCWRKAKVYTQDDQVEARQDEEMKQEHQVVVKQGL